MNQEEIWKDVVGYEGLYQVSNLGRVKSYPKLRRGNGNSFVRVKPRVMKDKNTHGYRAINLTKDSVSTTYLVHRIVAMAFILNPKNKKTVNHKNGIKHDNRVVNLEWMTYSENNKHGYRVLMNPPTRGYTGRFGKLHHGSKPIGKFTKDGKLVESYEGLSDASRKTGIFISSIHKVVSGLRKTCHGHVWKYL